MLLGLSRHSVTAGDLADLHAVVGGAVVSDQFFSGCADLGLDLRIIDLRIIDNPALADNRILHQLDHVFQANRRFRRVNDGFEFGFQTHLVNSRQIHRSFVRQRTPHSG